MTVFLPAPIPHEKWREKAACAGHSEPQLWDCSVHGETAEDAAYRHAAAIRVCDTCPVRNECLAAVDWTWDEGVRGGIVLPKKKHAARVSVERRAS